MPMHDFKCVCGKVFEELVSPNVSLYPCPICGKEAIKIFPTKAPYTKIKGITGLDKKSPDGIPIGELPGDSDYEGMNLPGYFGAAP